MPDYCRYFVAFTAMKVTEQGVTPHSAINALTVARDIADDEILVQAHRVFPPSEGFIAHGWKVYPSETIREWLDCPMPK